MHLVSNHLNIHSVTNRKSANIGFEEKSFENFPKTLFVQTRKRGDRVYQIQWTHLYSCNPQYWSHFLLE